MKQFLQKIFDELPIFLCTLVMLGLGAWMISFSRHLDTVGDWLGLVFGLVLCYVPIQAWVTTFIEVRRRPNVDEARESPPPDDINGDYDSGNSKP